MRKVKSKKHLQNRRKSNKPSKKKKKAFKGTRFARAQRFDSRNRIDDWQM